MSGAFELWQPEFLPIFLRSCCCSFASLDPLWRRLYVDLGHCRLRKCIRAIESASMKQLEALPAKSSGERYAFTAVAIAAASAYGASKEAELCAYLRAVLQRGLDANDTHHDNTTLALAAYHGYLPVLEVLLAAGYSLESRGKYGNAVMAAVKNGQLSALELLLQRPDATVVASTAPAQYPRGESVLHRAIVNRDVESTRLLLRAGARLSNEDYARLCTCRLEQSRLEPLLHRLHPSVPSVARWSAQTHWSFATTDRESLALLWFAVRRPTARNLLPEELWLRVFSFIERGWWASRECYPNGRPLSNILPVNIE